MLNINEADLKAAIVEKAVEELMRSEDDITDSIRTSLESKVNAIFAAQAEKQIQAVIAQAINDGFDREYQRVDSFGVPVGTKTSIRKSLETIVSGYWAEKVCPRTGKPGDHYGAVTRAEYTMTQMCAADFGETMRQHAVNVTGHLKDGMRNQLAAHMDKMLNELFKVKSLQDQGKVVKPY